MFIPDNEIKILATINLKIQIFSLLFILQVLKICEVDVVNMK